MPDMQSNCQIKVKITNWTEKNKIPKTFSSTRFGVFFYNLSLCFVLSIPSLVDVVVVVNDVENDLMVCTWSLLITVWLEERRVMGGFWLILCARKYILPKGKLSTVFFSSSRFATFHDMTVLFLTLHFSAVGSFRIEITLRCNRKFD